jgi:hypothetical protein
MMDTFVDKANQWCKCHTTKIFILLCCGYALCFYLISQIHTVTNIDALIKVFALCVYTISTGGYGYFAYISYKKELKE